MARTAVSNEEATSAESTSPVGEIEGLEAEEEVQPEPAAEETGVIEADEEPKHEETIPYERFQQVNSENERLRQQVEVYDQLFTKQTQAAPTAAPALAQPEELVPLPEGYTRDDLDEVQQVLYDQLVVQRRQAKALQEYIAQTENDRAMSEFSSSVAALETTTGIKMDDDTRKELLTQAAYLQRGAQSVGVTLSVSEAVNNAYGVVAYKAEAKRKAAEDRQAVLRQAKAGITAARPGAVAGPSTPTAVERMTPDEAANRAYREVFGE